MNKTLTTRTRLGNTVEFSDYPYDPEYVKISYLDNNDEELLTFPIKELDLVHFLEMRGYRVARKEFDYIR